MKSKQELKKVFENGDKPKQEDFWEWQDSYWHKEEMIPKEKIEGLELNSVDFNMQWTSTEKKLSLLDSLGNKISEISLQSLDNEGTDLRYNASTLSLELYNADNELLDSIPITDFVKNVGTQLSLNSNTLQLKDSVGNVLSTVSFAVSNISGLQTALDGKLNVPTMSNNYYGLWDDVNKKFINGDYQKQTNGSMQYIGSYGYTTDSTAYWKYPAPSRAIFNVGWAGSETNMNFQSGDVFCSNNQLWMRLDDDLWGGVNKKMTGIDLDGMNVGSIKTNWNTIHTLPRSSRASLYSMGEGYGRKLNEEWGDTSNTYGYDNRMYSGTLYTSVVDRAGRKVQWFLDWTGQFFYRGQENTWYKALGEKINTTTQLSEKLSLARVKLKSYSKTERDALSNKEVGEIIWQTDNGNSGIRVFDGTNWLALQTTLD